MSMRNTDNILRLLAALSNDLPTRPASGIGLDDRFDLADQLIKTITD